MTEFPYSFLSGTTLNHPVIAILSSTFIASWLLPIYCQPLRLFLKRLSNERGTGNRKHFSLCRKEHRSEMKFSMFSVTISCTIRLLKIKTYSNSNTVFNCIYLIMSICVFGNMVHWLLTVNVWQMLTFSRKCFLKALFLVQLLFLNLSIRVYVLGGKHQNEC